MGKNLLWSSIVISLVLALHLLVMTEAFAGTKDLDAGKRVKYGDGTVKNMRDTFERRELEDKEYRTTMIKNSEESLKLLEQIRNLLQQLNEK